MQRRGKEDMKSQKASGLPHYAPSLGHTRQIIWSSTPQTTAGTRDTRDTPRHGATPLLHLIDLELPLVAGVLGPPDADAPRDSPEPIVPLALLLAERALDPAPRVVDGRLATDEDGAVVQEGAEQRAQDRPAPRPHEPVGTLKGALGAVAQHEERQSGPHVARRVHGEAGVPPEGHGEHGDDKAQDEGVHAGSGGRIAVVAEGEDRDGHDGRPRELGEEGGGGVDPGVSRVRDEGGGGVGARPVRAAGGDLDDALAEEAEGDERGDEGAQDLGEAVHRNLAQGEAAVDPEHDGHGRVEVRTGDATGDVDADHGREAPRPVGGDAVARGVLRAVDDEVRAESKGELAGDGEELGKRLSELETDDGPVGVQVVNLVELRIERRKRLSFLLDPFVVQLFVYQIRKVRHIIGVVILVRSLQLGDRGQLRDIDAVAAGPLARLFGVESSHLF